MEDQDAISLLLLVRLSHQMPTHDTALNTFYSQFQALCNIRQSYEEDIADYNIRYMALLELAVYSHNLLCKVQADKDLAGIDKLWLSVCYTSSHSTFRTFAEHVVQTNLQTKDVTALTIKAEEWFRTQTAATAGTYTRLHESFNAPTVPQAHAQGPSGTTTPGRVYLSDMDESSPS